MFRHKLIFTVMMLSMAGNAVAAVKAIKFGKLWDGHNVINNAVVIVDGDKITSVTANGRIPAEAEVIDLSRYTGMPGMIRIRI